MVDLSVCISSTHFLTGCSYEHTVGESPLIDGELLSGRALATHLCKSCLTYSITAQGSPIEDFNRASSLLLRPPRGKRVCIYAPLLEHAARVQHTRTHAHNAGA